MRRSFQVQKSFGKNKIKYKPSSHDWFVIITFWAKMFESNRKQHLWDDLWCLWLQLLLRWLPSFAFFSLLTEQNKKRHDDDKRSNEKRIFNRIWFAQEGSPPREQHSNGNELKFKILTFHIRSWPAWSIKDDSDFLRDDDAWFERMWKWNEFHEISNLSHFVAFSSFSNDLMTTRLSLLHACMCGMQKICPLWLCRKKTFIHSAVSSRTVATSWDDGSEWWHWIPSQVEQTWPFCMQKTWPSSQHHSTRVNSMREMQKLCSDRQNSKGKGWWSAEAFCKRRRKNCKTAAK